MCSRPEDGDTAPSAAEGGERAHHVYGRDPGYLVVSGGKQSPIFCLREKADPQSHPQGRIRLWGEVRP